MSLRLVCSFTCEHLANSIVTRSVDIPRWRRMGNSASEVVARHVLRSHIFLIRLSLSLSTLSTLMHGCEWWSNLSSSLRIGSFVFSTFCSLFCSSRFVVKFASCQCSRTRIIPVHSRRSGPVKRRLGKETTSELERAISRIAREVSSMAYGRGTLPGCGPPLNVERSTLLFVFSAWTACSIWLPLAFYRIPAPL